MYISNGDSVYAVFPSPPNVGQTSRDITILGSNRLEKKGRKIKEEESMVPTRAGWAFYSIIE